MTNFEFETIYHTYFDKVYHYLLGLSKNPEIAQDLTSDVFFKALHTIDRFRGQCELQSWLFQIAKNSWYSYLRRHPHADLPITPDTPIVSPDIEEQLASKDTAMQVYTILHTLEEPYKEVFSLRIFGELRFAQIGEVFGKTENWACVVYHRAKKQIQAKLEEIL